MPTPRRTEKAGWVREGGTPPRYKSTRGMQPTWPLEYFSDRPPYRKESRGGLGGRHATPVQDPGRYEFLKRLKIVLKDIA